MQCPICAGQARNLTPNTLDGVVVGCDHCGDYRIAGAAFYELTTLAADARAAALAAARLASSGGWPTISRGCIRASAGGGAGSGPRHPRAARAGALA
jgi:hypothetical protein